MRIIPDIRIRVEGVGGGASPFGFVALKYPDELHSEYIAEGWTERDCFRRTVLAVLGRETYDFDRAFPHDNRLWQAFADPVSRVFVLHEIEDNCLAIDLPGGLLG